ncbi:MAG: peroxiredoxin [Pseudomonadales bacterium]|nr:peroxiredoxin [Pseudomonadales bacterium]
MDVVLIRYGWWVEMLNIGDTAPQFSLLDDNEDEVTLSSLLESGPLILYFYPADFTPICTAEACGIRDMHEEILSVDIKIVGISPQNTNTHNRFKNRYDIPFPLLFDKSKKVIRAFGVDGILGIGVRRTTFLINENAEIENRVVSDLFVSNHMKFIEQVISARSENSDAE